MKDMVKIQNIKKPKVIMKVKKSIAGDYIGTKEWVIYEEPKTNNSVDKK